MADEIDKRNEKPNGKAEAGEAEGQDGRAGNSRFKEMLRAIIFILIGAVVWVGLCRVFRFKEGYYYKTPYYESQADYDILIFGASHPHNAIDPMVLWEDYGITAYNLATSGEPMPLSYFAVKSALDHHAPEAIILDAGKIADNVIQIGQAHKALDGVPLGKSKMEAIHYLLRMGVIESPFEMLSDMWSYHSRIYEINRFDFELLKSRDKGGYMASGVRQVKVPPSPTLERTEIEDGEGLESYQKIMDLCGERGVRLILTLIPSNYSDKRVSFFNELSDRTLREGFEILDLNRASGEIGIDYDYDFANRSHLNQMGAKKVSEYLGETLLRDFGFKDHRGDPSYSHWEEDRKDAVADRLQYLKYEDNAVRYLMAAGDRLLRAKVYLRDLDALDTVYAFSCVSRFADAEILSADDDILGDYDALIQVYDLRDSDSGSEPACEKFFYYNKKDALLTTTGEAVESVNYFPEVED